ncbi:F-box/kelch-repeat protein At3g06240-like [Papaver somniferum]|uniref:F-box/kelch-repeat protein At3g06240-like n=1 Tax=Papaver somniferum TaxID=3469 RepID=UPI000E7004D5|nr:F-box/kelch-repeat protein At3g06240-like [Papaver somniferum]
MKHIEMVAFGYDCKSENYKLFSGSFIILFEVYSLGSKSWKTLENVPYKFVYPSKPSNVIVNGDFHWLSKRKDSPGVLLVFLDISNEIFKEMELPKEPLDKGSWFRNLGVFEGCLCVFVNANCVHFEIWIMRDYGVQESWTKHCVITHDRFMGFRSPLLISSFKSGTILFEVSGKLVVYDPRKKSAMDLNIPGSIQLLQESWYFESLVLLNSGTYVGC